MTPLRTLLCGAALALAATAPAALGEDPPFPLCAENPPHNPVACVDYPPLCVLTYEPTPVAVTWCP